MGKSCLGLRVLRPAPTPPQTESITPMAETQPHESRERTSEDTLHTAVNREALQASEVCGKPRDFIAQPQRAQSSIHLAKVLSYHFFFFLILKFKLHCVRLCFFIFLPFNEHENSGRIITRRLYSYGRLGSRYSYK